MAALLCAAATAASQQQPVPAGWTTWRDTRAGFELRHPPGWTARTGEGSGGLTVIVGEPPRAGQPARQVQFWIQRQANPGGLPIRQWVAAQLARMPSAQPPASSDASLGGRPAVRMEATGSFGRTVTLYAALNRTDVFQAILRQPAGEARLSPIDEQVLASVRFME